MEQNWERIIGTHSWILESTNWNMTTELMIYFNDVIDDYLLVRVIQVCAKKDCLATLVLFHNLFDCCCVLGFLIFIPRVEEGATSIE